MVREFKLPDVGEGVAEGEIVQWLVEPGDPVSEDQPVAEVETDKAVVEVPSPVDGTVKELRAEAGEVVPVGEVIIVFDVDGEEPDEEASKAADEGTEPGDDRPDESGEDGAGPSTNGESGGRVFAAPSARRLARELGVDLAAVDGSGPGGRITEMDVHTAAETDAVDSGEPDPAEGDATEASAADAADPGDDPAAATGEAEEPLGGAQPTVVEGEQPTTEGAAAPTDAEPAERDRTLATPATRGVATELDVDIDAVPATEEREGEAVVTTEAVREYAERQRRAQKADAEAVAAGGDGRAGESASPAVAAGTAERIPYRGVRRTIGQQMERSKFTAPHVTHHDRVDVTELVEARDDLAERAEERGIKLTYLPFVVKAVVAALREYPILNSRLDEQEEEIVQYGDYNVGIATATDAGLMVPVVDDAGQKSLLDIASEANELVSRARSRSIAREEMQGGTFTITNFGAIGGEYATPIVNYPETAILGLGAIKKRPWVVEREARSASDGTNGEPVSGEVVPRHVMTLSLSIDHRVIDGAEAARFTNTLKQYLRDPTLLLLE